MSVGAAVPAGFGVGSDGLVELIGRDWRAMRRRLPVNVAMAALSIAAVCRYVFEYISISTGPASALAPKQEGYPMAFSRSLMGVTNLMLEGMGIILGALAIASLGVRSFRVALPPVQGRQGFVARVASLAEQEL